MEEGGLLETIIHGETGSLLPPNPSPEELIVAVEEMNQKKANSMRAACEERAVIFRTEEFIKKISKTID